MTLPPAQKVNEPDAVIVGVAGKAFTVTFVEACTTHPPLSIEHEIVLEPAGKRPGEYDGVKTVV